MSAELTHARVLDALQRLRLGQVADQLDALLSDGARHELTYLDFLDRVLAAEVESKQRKRVAMGMSRTVVNPQVSAHRSEVIPQLGRR